jgi:uncharacterized protein (DUF3820 family)
VLTPPFDDYTDLLLSSVPEMELGWLEKVIAPPHGKRGELMGGLRFLRRNRSGILEGSGAAPGGNVPVCQPWVCHR